MKDFFVSYNSADKNWAAWIASTLEANSFSTVFQDWDFGPGVNFVLEMDKALKDSTSVIAVLSPNYLASVYTQPEWAGAFVLDPKGEQRRLFPIRVAPCEPEGLLKSIVYSDLVGLQNADAEKKLLADATRIARGTSDRPVGKVPFPGGQATASPEPPVTTLDAARRLYDILQTTRTTFLAQVELRNQLVASAEHRLGSDENLEYEPFLQRYFSQLSDDELRLHKTMRAYTADILAKYNKRALDLVDKYPSLSDSAASIPALKQHLIIWLTKFKNEFAANPWMALVYVGVEEKVPFPRAIDSQLKSFLQASGVRV